MNPLKTIACCCALLIPIGGFAEERPAQMSIGNGDRNWIVTEGARRSGAVLTFREVQIDGNGWLVLHPFENGKPNGNVVAGSTYISDGLNQDVRIEVTSQPSTGENFIVMLHSDVDNDGNFDFVFVGDTGHVEDRAVFEGSRMIAHIFTVP